MNCQTISTWEQNTVLKIKEGKTFIMYDSTIAHEKHGQWSGPQIRRTGVNTPYR